MEVSGILFGHRQLEDFFGYGQSLQTANQREREKAGFIDWLMSAMFA